MERREGSALRSSIERDRCQEADQSGRGLPRLVHETRQPGSGAASRRLHAERVRPAADRRSPDRQTAGPVLGTERHRRDLPAHAATTRRGQGIEAVAPAVLWPSRGSTPARDRNRFRIRASTALQTRPVGRNRCCRAAGRRRSHL